MIVRCCKCGHRTNKLRCTRCQHSVCTSCKSIPRVTKKRFLKAVMDHHNDNPILDALEARRAVEGKNGKLL